MVAKFEDNSEYPAWARYVPSSRGPSVAVFWRSTGIVIGITFAVCWVLDVFVVSPGTELLLQPAVAHVLQWPVLVYSLCVLTFSLLVHVGMGVWYLLYATPWAELGGAGVLHAQPQSPLVHAYHNLYF
jgi:succinate dehydrogenase/fumarate reductase cytochrome b subunit